MSASIFRRPSWAWGQHAPLCLHLSVPVLWCTQGHGDTVGQTDCAGPASASPPLCLTSLCLLLMDSNASTARNKALKNFSFMEGLTIEPQNSQPEKKSNWCPLKPSSRNSLNHSCLLSFSLKARWELTVWNTSGGDWQDIHMWRMFVKLFLSSLETRRLMPLHERHTFLPKWGGAVKAASYYLYFIFKLKKWSEMKVTQSCLILCVCVWVCEVAQLCPTLCDLVDCSPPGSSLHGILQARILGWVAFPFSRGSSQPRDWTQVSHIAGGFFTSWATREDQEYWSG